MNNRDKWLVIDGFIAGYRAAGGNSPPDVRVSDLAKKWLGDNAADGVTVEMLLDKEMEALAEPTLRDEFALSAPADPWPEFEPVMPDPPAPPTAHPVGNNGGWPDEEALHALTEWRKDPTWDAESSYPKYSIWVKSWRAYWGDMRQYGHRRAIQRRIQWPYWYADQMMAERDRKR